MKKYIIILFFAFFAVSASAQVNFKHLVGDITVNDIKAVNSLKSGLNGISSTSLFLRLAVTETAYEVPLFKGGGGNFFTGTGVGVSLACYKSDGKEKFTTNLIPLIDNATKKYSSVSATIGVPIIPNIGLSGYNGGINAGIRYDWNINIFFLQTGISLEF